MPAAHLHGMTGGEGIERDPPPPHRQNVYTCQNFRPWPLVIQVLERHKFVERKELLLMLLLGVEIVLFKSSGTWVKCNFLYFPTHPPQVFKQSMFLLSSFPPPFPSQDDWLLVLVAKVQKGGGENRETDTEDLKVGA